MIYTSLKLPVFKCASQIYNFILKTEIPEKIHITTILAKTIKSIQFSIKNPRFRPGKNNFRFVRFYIMQKVKNTLFIPE